MSQLTAHLTGVQIGGRRPLGPRVGAPPPDRPGPDRFRSAARSLVRDHPATPRSVDDRTRHRPIGFLVQELLASAPELGAAAPRASLAGITASVSAYDSRVAARISYSGPVMPVNLLA